MAGSLLNRWLAGAFTPLARPVFTTFLMISLAALGMLATDLRTRTMVSSSASSRKSGR